MVEPGKLAASTLSTYELPKIIQTARSLVSHAGVSGYLLCVREREGKGNWPVVWR